MLALAVAAFFLLDAGRFLSLGVLKQSQATLASIYAQRPSTVLAGFFAVYVAVATLSIPGAAVMTLAGGALFGLGPGLVLASFASSLGALLAFLSARFFLQAMVRRRFGQRLQEIDRGVEELVGQFAVAHAGPSGTASGVCVADHRAVWTSAVSIRWWGPRGT